MFKIKICGVTSAADAAMCADAGAEAIGLNFYPKSPRCVSLETAREIVDSIRETTLAKVGVFVNAPAKEVQQTATELDLDFVQIHGDEPPEYLAELAGRKVIRAFRCRDEGLAAVEAYLAESTANLAAVLIDAYSPGAYGGTGEVVDWTTLVKYGGEIEELPLILAGGLTPANVAEAIESTWAYAVDTASGVELSPGVKDTEKTRAFVAEARRAFGATDETRIGHG